MRKATTVQKVQTPAPDTVTKVIPSPTDGWDAITPLAEMDPKRAPILDNWVPRPGYVEIRAGYQPYAMTNLSTPVDTLLVHRSSTTEKLFAASGDGIYNVSNPSSVTKDVSGQTSAKYNYVNFTPSGGTSVIQVVNGLDALLQYDGTAWTNPSITGLPGSTANIINIYAQKKRLWYIMESTTIAAFMPTDAISGPIAGTLDLGNEWTKGGYLVAMSSWTVDGGNGPQDYAVFISSQGETTIFAGTNPADANAWSLVGTFPLPPPIGRRCLYRVGSDVAVITQQGVLPLSQSLPFDPSADRSVAITARIQNAMAQAAMIGQDIYGWQVISYANQQLAVINVPQVANSTSYQFVMNALTGSWCRFTGWNTSCFEVWNGDLYFGDFGGYVNLAYSTGTDAGNPINYDMQCAFNWFDDPGRTKRMTMIQPLLVSTGDVTATMGVDEDFTVGNQTAQLTTISGSSLWDQAIWDTSIWGGALKAVSTWYSVQAIGHALAIHMSIANQTNAAQHGVFDIAEFDSALFDQALDSAATLQVNAFNSILELGAFI